MFKPEAGVAYDLPVVFGSSLVPEVTRWKKVTLATTSYFTDRAAAEKLVPYHFALADEPVVNIVRVSYDGVDYIDGSYQEFGVGLSVVHEGPKGKTAGTYYLAMWLDRSEPIIVGRELLGYAKIGGELPEPIRVDDTLSFEVFDQGERLARGEFRELEQLDEERASRVSQFFNPAIVLGWKYIPALGGEVDADYPIRIPLHFEFDRIWTGAATVTFDHESERMPPLARRIVGGISTLPIREWRRGLVAEGRGTLPRNEAQKLDSP
jgi:acetoacetate decarboxylase